MVGDLDRLPVRLASARRALGRRSGSNRRRRAQILNRLVDDVPVDVELAVHDVAPVDRRGERGRQLNALLGLVADERRSIGDVSEVDVRSHIAHPRGKIRCPIHSERQRVSLPHRDVDKLLVSLFAQVRQLARGIEGRAHDRDRMGKQFHSALPGGRNPRRLRLRSSGLGSRQESSADVVGDVTVQRLVCPIQPELPHCRCKHEIHLQALLDARAPVLEIDHSPVLERLLPFLGCRGIAGDVPAAIEIRQLPVADDLQGLECHDALAAAKRLRRPRYQLKFLTGSLTGDTDHERRAGRHRHRHRGEPLVHRLLPFRARWIGNYL